MSTVHCPNCGYANAAESKFCSQCGTKLDTTLSGETTRMVAIDLEGAFLKDLSPEDQAAVRSLPPGSALLIVQRGVSVGERFLLDQSSATAGRHPHADIFLDDVTVSRHHAQFIRTHEGLEVEDLGSLNGTYVNRRLIEGPARLHTGDEVQIGKFRMICFVSAGPR